MSLVLVACTSSHRVPDPTTASGDPPAAAPSVTLKTIRDSEIGARLTITAVLVTVLSEHSFTVYDVDLPDQGLLVLGHLPVSAQPNDLITVRGVITTFDFECLRSACGLDEEERYEVFRSRKILATQDIHSWS
jgi:hypothetical protein